MTNPVTFSTAVNTITRVNDLVDTYEPTSGWVLGETTIEWLSLPGILRTETNPRKLLDLDLYLAMPIREGNRYPRMRNYHGRYYFNSIGKQVWHESLLERDMLLALDYVGETVAIAAQPMKLTFDDGSVHFPDFLSLDADGGQTLYDVKPAARINEKYETQFAKTAAFCREAGYRYEVLTGLAAQKRTNLLFLRDYRAQKYRPSTEHRTILMNDTDPLMVCDAAYILSPDDLRLGHTHALHLLWHRALEFDISAPLTSATSVRNAA